MIRSAKKFAAAVFVLCLVAPVYAKTSERGVTPTEHQGNFVASDDDQVCYELVGLGLIGGVTSEMRGFKIDPPTDFDDGNVSITLSNKGKELAWQAVLGVEVHAFIIKGGPAYHVYNYVDTGYIWDAKLVSPISKKSVPQISHYNVCYTPPAGEDQGCTPGYWRNHADRWLGVAPGDDFDATFGVALFSPDITLGTAIQLGGGGVNALARHATAALLNAYGGVPNISDGTTVAYPYEPEDVILAVQEAADSEDPNAIEVLKNLFATANELGCPLSGTSAVKVD